MIDSSIINIVYLFAKIQPIQFSHYSISPTTWHPNRRNMKTFPNRFSATTNCQTKLCDLVCRNNRIAFAFTQAFCFCENSHPKNKIARLGIK